MRQRQFQWDLTRFKYRGLRTRSAIPSPTKFVKTLKPTMSNVQYFVVVPKKQYGFAIKNVGTIDQPSILVEESSLPFDLTPFYASDRVQLYETSTAFTLTWDHVRFELVSSIVNATDQLFGYTSSTTYSNYRARLHQTFTRYFRNEAEH